MRPVGRRSLFVGAAAVSVAMLPAPAVATGIEPVAASLIAANHRLSEQVASLLREIERLTDELHRLSGSAAEAMARAAQDLIEPLSVDIHWAANDAAPLEAT